MAKNWKRAAEKLQADNADLLKKLGDTRADLDGANANCNSACIRLAQACAHMQAASEHFGNVGMIATARMLRDEAVRLTPIVADQAVTRERR